MKLKHLFSKMNALVAISKGMRAVKLRTNKILQFLEVGLHVQEITKMTIDYTFSATQLSIKSLLTFRR